MTPAGKLKDDERVPPEYRLIAAIIWRAELDASAGNDEAKDWLNWIRQPTNRKEQQ